MESPVKKIRSTITRITGDRDIYFSFIAILVVISITTLFLTINIIGTTYEYNIGDIAKENIRVDREISYVNNSETLMEKKRAAETVPIVYDKDASVLTENLNRINKLIDSISYTLKQYPPVGNDLTFQVYAVKSVIPQYLNYDDFMIAEIARQKDLEAMKKVFYRIIIYLYDDPDMGIIVKAHETPPGISTSNITVRTINTPDPFDETTRTIKSLKTMNEIKPQIQGITKSFAPNLSPGAHKAIAYFIEQELKPNMSMNIEETKRRISEAAKGVKPIMGQLKKGQTIVREGDTITSEIKSKLDIYNKKTATFHTSYIAGIFFLQLIFFTIFGYFFLSFKSVLIPERKSTAIILSFIIVFIIYTFILSRSESMVENKYLFVFLLPISFTTMIISILFNTYISVLVGIFIVFFTSQITGGEINAVIISFTSALLGMFINENVQRRSDFLKGGLLIGIINLAQLLAVILIMEIPIKDMAKYLYIPLASGIVNSILVLGILPIYENLFGITTKFKLLELSDLNADIFKRMLLEAPGTYNHSLIVSTMAEAACKEIDANHLLARVGAYHHDIGKIPDAGIYIENRATDPRAKTMNPSEYSHIIISHVGQGVEMARENKLPESVIDFIREHHGRTVMTFFYHQALENASKVDNGPVINKEDFQYPGPMPHSKETAIVMLADAVEAASRSLKEPSFEKIEGIVRKIIFNKLNEGDLDMADLSMSEINSVQQTFVKILGGIFHTRIEYPEKSDIKKLEKEILKQDE